MDELVIMDMLYDDKVNGEIELGIPFKRYPNFPIIVYIKYRYINLLCNLHDILTNEAKSTISNVF